MGRERGRAPTPFGTRQDAADTILSSTRRQYLRGDFQPVLETALIERVREAKARDPLAAVVVVVPSNLLRVYLRRRLAEAGAHLGVRIESLSGLVEEFAFPERVRSGLAKMPTLAPRLFAEAAIAQMPEVSSFAPLRRMPGFPGRLAATIRDLRDAAITPEMVLACAESPKQRDLAALYAEFEQRRCAARLADDAENLALAAAGVKTHDRFGADVTLVIHGFYDFVTLQQRFVEALLQRYGGLVLCPAPVGESGEYGERFLERLRALGFEELPTTRAHAPAEPGTDLELFRARSTDRFAARGRGIRGDKTVRFMAPRFRGEEARDTLRIVRELAGKGVPLHEIGILSRQQSSVRWIASEAARLETALPGAKLPLFEQGGHALAEEAPARALARLSEALQTNLERVSVLAFLDATDRFPRAFAYARLARRESIRGGEGAAEWHAALAIVESIPARSRTTDEEEKTDTRRMTDAGDAAALRSIVSILAAARASIAQADSFSGATSALRAALGRLCGEEALDLLSPIFAALAQVDLARSAYSIETFFSLVPDAIEGASTSSGGFQKGLFAGGLLGSRGLSFRAVILPTLEEGVFPRRAMQDPLLLDEERLTLSKLFAKVGEPGLPCPTRRAAAEERLLFHLACSAARETLVFSCPRFEDASETEIVASAAWRVALELMHGAALPKGDPRKVEDLAPLFFERDASPLDLTEWDRSRITKAAREVGGGKIARFLNALDPIVDRALRGEFRRRSAKVFTEFDGVVSSTTWKKRARELTAEPLSVTRLERYAMCPFKYFASRVLELDPSDPRAESTIDFRARGEVIHESAEHFFHALHRRDEPWPLDPSRRGELLVEFLTIGRAVFAKFAAETTLPQVIEEVAGQLIDRELEALLDFEYASPRAARPRRFEVEFDREHGSEVRFVAGASAVSFAGKIDRIDVDEAAHTAIVVDYKTGNKPAPADREPGLGGGRRMQLPVYALAAQRVLGDAVTVTESEYFYCSRAGDGLRVATDEQGFTGEGLAELSKVVLALVDGVRGGVFFADPSDEKVCKHCELKLACGKGPFLENAYARKQSDPAVAAIQAVRNAEAATEVDGDEGSESP